MKIISTKLHGILDYPWGMLLVGFPWLFDIAPGGAASTIPVVLGLLMLLGSFFTDYEMGVFRFLSMRIHLAVDIISAIFLAASPWIFGFHETDYQPYLIIGSIQLLLALLTQTHPRRRRGPEF